MKQKLSFIAIILATALFPIKSYSRALDNTGMVPLLSLGVGAFNVCQRETTAQFQIEYRSALSFIKARPFIGAFTTTKSNFYLYGGLGWDLHFSKYLVVTPSFAPGLYLHGNDKKLGYPLEFRTSLEVAYKFKNKARLGLQFYHISNASIGEHNPGAESLMLFYSIPLTGGR